MLLSPIFSVALFFTRVLLAELLEKTTCQLNFFNPAIQNSIILVSYLLTSVNNNHKKVIISEGA